MTVIEMTPTQRAALDLLATAQRHMGVCTVDALALRARRILPDTPFEDLHRAVMWMSERGLARSRSCGADGHQWSLTSAGWDLAGNRPDWL